LLKSSCPNSYFSYFWIVFSLISMCGFDIEIFLSYHTPWNALFSRKRALPIVTFPQFRKARYLVNRHSKSEHYDAWTNKSRYFILSHDWLWERNRDFLSIHRGFESEVLRDIESEEVL
jgi:hypothetical protein